jgi:hypothetical protein
MKYYMQAKRPRWYGDTRPGKAKYKLTWQMAFPVNKWRWSLAKIA